MARLNIATKVVAPAEITIPLMRADQVFTSSVFRVCFEVFLALFSSFFGYFIGLSKPTTLHWVVLAVFGIAAIGFLGVSLWFASRAKLD